MKANKFSKAAEKYSEAIQILSNNPSLGSNKDMLTLYNNRSAMFEKSEAFPQALEDILIVLSLDPLHIKARIRRSRIYEAQVRYYSIYCEESIFQYLIQGKLRDAISDYMIAIVVEQTKGESNPSTNMEKIESLCAATAKLVRLLLHSFDRRLLDMIQELPSYIEGFIAKADERALPSPGYARPYFESFPASLMRPSLSG